MRRTGRRFSEDFLEENNEEITYEDYETTESEETEYEEYFDLSDLQDDVPVETDKKCSSPLRKIGKILIIILVLIALFFASAKITEIILDHNEEPASYGNDAPDMDEDFDEIIDEDDDIITDTNIPDVLGGEDDGADYMPEPAEKPEETPTTSESPSTSPSPSTTPEVSPKPSENPAPSTAPTPSEAPKPAIKPGNPAA